MRIVRCVIAAAIVLAAPSLAADSGAPMTVSPHPEARPFGDTARAGRDVADAMARAKANGHRVLLVFGANWCHDSRALAGWFATPHFAAMLNPRYEIVWIDVGQKDHNLDLARRFGLDGIKGTPTVLMLDSSGKPLNLEDAPRWHDASKRSEDKIYRYFAR